MNKKMGATITLASSTIMVLTVKTEVFLSWAFYAAISWVFTFWKQMKIHIWKLSNNTQVQGNRSMSRITYSNLYDNTKLKLF